MTGNPNVSYVVSDNAYPVYPYMSGNFGEHNQMDRMYYIKEKNSYFYINLCT